MTQKWNLQDIRPSQPRRRMPPEGAQITPQARPVQAPREEAEETMSIQIQNGNKKKSRSLIIAFIVFFLVVAGGIIASALTGGANITVYPKHREPVVNAVFDAKKDAQPGELPYEIMTLDADGERQVQASGTQKVSTQAAGTIFIYNEQQKDPLRLVANTRFESPSGLIFKIKDSAIVPGYTQDASGKKIAGVTTADVYAEQPGDSYNVAPSKFTVPGFKGQPEFLTVYGQSNEAFTGGYVGDKFIIADAELQTAQQSLRTELRNSLLARIDKEKPAGFVAFPGAVSFTYTSLPSVAYGDNLATIKEKVTMRIPVFKEGDLASFLAKATVPGYENEPVRIPDYSTLNFTYTDATTSATDISALTGISFTLSGKPQIIWAYDADKLKAQLLNLNKTALTGVLGGYPAIEKANAVIRPFWETKFPKKMEDIKITEVVGTSTSTQ